MGIVANQPKHLGGILENDSADKAARFINLCDAFNIPLLFLQDVPGFMVGTKVEQAGIIRHGAKMLYAVSRATVPKITVVIRKAYGAGYYVMCGKAYEPDLIVAWPSAEISVMGPEGAVNIIFRKQIEAAEDPDATRAEMIEGIRKTIDPYIAAGNAMIDDIIDPRETRPTVIRALEMADDASAWSRPWKKHGVMPRMSIASRNPRRSSRASICGAVANRDQCPAIPYTPEEYAAEARRAVDEGCSMIHIHARTPDGRAELRGRGLPRDHRGHPRRGGRRDHQLLDGRDRRADREAHRVPARAAARRGRAEHELDELREVLEVAQGRSCSRPCSRTRSTRSSSSSR